MKNARLGDCPVILEFLDTKLSELSDMGAMFGEDFNTELQTRIVDFLSSLSNEQLSYIFMMQFLTRGENE